LIIGRDRDEQTFGGGGRQDKNSSRQFAPCHRQGCRSILQDGDNLGSLSHGPGAGRKSVLMAATIVVACPNCQKQLKGPAEIQGKKVRCKSCGHTFSVSQQSTGK